MIREPFETSPAAALGNRFHPTEGIHNLRDYGGYALPGGGRVKTGLLYRSDQHFEATEADLALIHALGIRTIIDLRGISEREAYPCRRHPEFAADVLAHDGETSNSPPHEGGGGKVAMTAQRARERMLAVYTRMPVNPAMTQMFTRYFAALADTDGASLVHCFAGKDRTGIAAALLLHALGADPSDIMAEFLLTNDAPTRHILERQSLPRMAAHYGQIDAAALDNLMGVRPEYLDTFMVAMTRVHGSINAYLARELGVDEAMRDRLRERLTA